jgi:hypothetical protein
MPRLAGQLKGRGILAPKTMVSYAESGKRNRFFVRNPCLENRNLIILNNLLPTNYSIPLASDPSKGRETKRKIQGKEENSLG